MKKLIGILGVAVIAATMFFSANNVSGSSSDISLASLMSMNNANAQSEIAGAPGTCSTWCTKASGYTCVIKFPAQYYTCDSYRVGTVA